MSEQVSEQVVEPVVQAVVVEPVVEAAAVEPDGEVSEQIRNPEGYDKALKVEREARKELERKLSNFEAAEKEREQERIKASMSDQERAIVEAKESARAEVKSEYEGKIIRARVEAKAAAMNFHDPELTLSLLGDVPADVSDDDLVSALEQVGKDRPYLLKPSIPKMDMGPRTGSDGQSLGNGSSEDWFRNLVNKKQ